MANEEWGSHNSFMSYDERENLEEELRLKICHGLTNSFQAKYFGNRRGSVSRDALLGEVLGDK